MSSSKSQNSSENSPGPESTYAHTRYDSNGRPARTTDRLGNQTSATYDAASGRPTAFTDQEFGASSITNTQQTQGGFTFHRVSTIRRADGHSLSFTFDEKGNRATLTDQTNRQWRITRNARGQIETLTNPAGGVTTNTYNADGTRASVRTSAGHALSFGYDTAKRLIEIRHEDGASRRFQLDAVGNQIRITDERGNNTSATYDDNNRLRTVSDALGAIRTFAYNSDDRLASLTDALGKTQQWTYDASGRVQRFTNAAGNALIFAYDNLNRPTSVSDTGGQLATFGWDRENRLVSLTNALGRIRRRTRNRRGRVTRFTTPNNENYDFTYDAVGRFLTATNPLGQTAQFRYEPRGLLSGITLPGGFATSIERNELGLRTQVVDPNGSACRATYDSMGRRMSAIDPLERTERFEYDARQRVSRTQFPEGDARNTFDAAGNLVRRLFSDGTDLTFAYDAANRLTQASGIARTYDAANRITMSNGIRTDYDDANRISAVTYAAGKVVRYTYNERGWLTGVADWIGGSINFTYNTAGEVTAKALPNGVREEYTYDANGRRSAIRVLRSTTALSSVTVTRDAAGKITSEDRSADQIPDVPSGYQPFAYNAANELIGLTYDANGNRTRDAFRTYEFDAAGRLKAFNGAGNANYTFDALDRIITRRSSSETFTKRYVYNDGLPGSAPSIVRDDSADRFYNVFLPGGTPLVIIDAVNNSRNFLHFDVRGSATAVTNDQGNIQINYRATPDGDTLFRTGSGFNPFTFNGASGWMQEGETGLFLQPSTGVVYDSATQTILARPFNTSGGPILSAFPDVIKTPTPSGSVAVPWAASSRRRVRILRSPEERPFGGFTQVSRLGLPLINETVIGLQDRDTWNRVTRNWAAPNDGLHQLGENCASCHPDGLSDISWVFNPSPHQTPANPSFTNIIDEARSFFINPAGTNLLFPSVTGQPGFDPGIAIPNVSLNLFPQPGVPFLNTTSQPPQTVPLPELETGDEEVIDQEFDEFGDIEDFEERSDEEIVARSSSLGGCAAANFTHLGGTPLQRVATLAVVWLPLGVLALLRRRSRRSRRRRS